MIKPTKTILLGISLAFTIHPMNSSRADTTTISPNVQKELNAWQKAAPLISEKCSKGKKPEETHPNEAVEITKCITALLNKTVVPKVVYPDLITSMREDAIGNAQAYKAGTISNEEYVARGHGNWKNYLQNLEFRMNNSAFYGEK